MRVSLQPHVKHQLQVRGSSAGKASQSEAAARDARRAEDHPPIRRSEGRLSATAAGDLRRRYQVALRPLLHDTERQTSPGPRFEAQVRNLPSAVEQWAQPRQASKPSRLRNYAAKATK